jgi:hypothetical protein
MDIRRYLSQDDTVLLTMNDLQNKLFIAQQDALALVAERIRDEIDYVSNPMMVDKEFLDGLEKALDVIKGEQK